MEAIIESIPRYARNTVHVEPTKDGPAGKAVGSASYHVEEAAAKKLAREKFININGKRYETCEFISLPCCMNCQMIKGHLTKDCQLPYQENKICHKCAKEGHTLSQCQATTPACYNCQAQGHPANSTTCPIYRANVIKELMKRQQESANEVENNRSTQE